MKKIAKKLLVFGLISMLAFAMTGCSLFGNGKKAYANYVMSLMDVNYKAEYASYMNITGTTEDEAAVVYSDGLDYLAEALMVAYGVNDVEGSDIKSQFRDLAAEIYSHAKYEVKNVTKTDGVYQVTVTIYPIDILQITYSDIVNYIEETNDKVTAGYYNDYELDQYETEYAQGIINILKNYLEQIGNGEGVEVTVTIQDNGEYFYISDEDFLALDKAILARTIVNSDGTGAGNDSTDEVDSQDTQASEDTQAPEDTEAESSEEASSEEAAE